MDNGLVQNEPEKLKDAVKGLNPCCSGQWSRTIISASIRVNAETS